MSDQITRREFVTRSVRYGVAASAVGAVPLNAWSTIAVPDGSGAPRVILIAVDSLDPRILELDADGEPGGSEDNWLMPNVRRFLAGSTWFRDARCHMPSATDMNHLNAVAGTSSAQTGIVGVSLQMLDWKPDGSPHIVNTSLSLARDDKGREVDTLFSAWKRRWPSSPTFFASGKGWVADMFRTPGSGVDMFLKGTDHPEYLEPPGHWSFYDPPQDRDRTSDSESWLQRMFCARAYDREPARFPSDHWIADGTLRMLERESPDLAMIILAQMDDAQHALGTVCRPEDFAWRRTMSHGRIAVHKYNENVFKEAILDAMRDVDRQFGSLVAGIRALPRYREATIVLYSDHGHVTHRRTIRSNFSAKLETDALKLLRKAGLISAEERAGRGVFNLGASSVGAVYVKGESLEERRRRAAEFKDALLEHRVFNEATGEMECPWYALVEKDMIDGMPGVVEPGELYHEHFSQVNDAGELHSPDLAILMRNGWQLPVAKRLVTNLGARLPWYLPDNINLFAGGHGSNDTTGIVVAFNGPDVAQGREIADPDGKRRHRISDIAVTLASRLGLELQSTTVGTDRTSDLG